MVQTDIIIKNFFNTHNNINSPTLAGIDVGRYTAIIIINLEGKPINKLSTKDISEAEILSFLKQNNVVVIATDKAKIPFKIKKIAARLNLGILYPKKDIDIYFKKMIYYQYEYIENTHERDALSAILYFYPKIKKIIEQTKKITNDPQKRFLILKTYFRNTNLLPKNILKEIDEDKDLNIKYKKDIKKDVIIKKVNNKTKNVQNNIKFVDLPIINMKKIDKQYLEKIKTLKKALKKALFFYIKTKNRLDSLSYAILKGRNLIPKLSFLKKFNKIKTKKIFVDSKILKKKEKINLLKFQEIYINYKDRHLLKYIICKSTSKIYFVKKYRDYINFIEPLEIEYINKEEKQIIKEVEKKEIEDLKDFIIRLKYS